ncbi:MAG TPA: BlaI/MecI/CopY family transcriptional regulator [Bryobacteraceae bacterium]|nr:BlaI/MecI/CopY family transcriptional regulator [Bryobacteraceae bacterium]
MPSHSDFPGPNAPMPTAAEADILAVLWRLGPATVREVHDALAKDSGYNTTLTQMRLMTEKGLLVRSERFRSHVYGPAAPKQQMQTRIAGDLLKRIFGGSPKGLILSALGAQPTTIEERAEIRHMLDQLDKRKKRSK